MKLIVGLGNPGKEYENTRHNSGYMAISQIADKFNAVFKLETKLEGEVASFFMGTEKVILLKPVTYMNLSGDSVSKVLNFYKIDVSDMIIIYDDLSLSIGKIRLRQKGSAGGHNGIKNIIAHIGDEFKRIKIGISKAPNDVKDYVLGNFSKSEMEMMNSSFKEIIDISEAFIQNESFDNLMNKYN